MLHCSKSSPVRRHPPARRDAWHGCRMPAKPETTMDPMTKTAETFTKAARDTAEFGRGNVEAVTQSAQAYLRGTQELGRQAFALAQDLNAQVIEGAKALV